MHRKGVRAAEQAREGAARSRRCAATGAVVPESRLVRLAVGRDGMVLPDVAARAPGRGLWVSAMRPAVEQALRRNQLTRGFEGARAPADIADRIEQALAQRVLDLLGMARRAGEIAIGQTEVGDLVGRTLPAIVFEAADGAPDGRRQVFEAVVRQRARAAARSGTAVQGPHIVGCFTAAELALAFGRGRVIHAAIRHGGMARRVGGELRRLAGFRTLAPEAWLAESGSAPLHADDPLPDPAAPDVAHDDNGPGPDGDRSESGLPGTRAPPAAANED
jgi:predicted RNA-binding protein YlxR (DUF448 family)